MTMFVVTHELASAFNIADRIAMLYKGSLVAVETKDGFKNSKHPRIRQFLDRQPDPIGTSAVAIQRMEELAGLTETRT